MRAERLVSETAAVVARPQTTQLLRGAKQSVATVTAAAVQRHKHDKLLCCCFSYYGLTSARSHFSLLLSLFLTRTSHYSAAAVTQS